MRVADLEMELDQDKTNKLELAGCPDEKSATIFAFRAMWQTSLVKQWSCLEAKTKELGGPETQADHHAVLRRKT